MTRDAQAKAFLDHAGWGSATVTALAGDASNRRYNRLVKADGTFAVLMDAPPDKGEDIRPFVHIAELLVAVGLSAPKVYAEDAAAGFLLLEDLGDRQFARELENDPTAEEQLYTAAVDVLTHLHAQPAPDLTPYAAAETATLAALAYDWYLFGATGHKAEHAKQAFIEMFEPILATYDDRLDALIQRDYHAENLIWLPERTGVARVGLLDFQDARRGHRAYDLVSVLQDARRDVSRHIEAQMKARFIANNGLDEDDFEAACAVFGLQRNLRILGVFVRLCLRDGKAHYVDLIPRVWAHVQTNLKHPTLAPLAKMIASDLPAPTTNVLAQLKEKCGACVGQ